MTQFLNRSIVAVCAVSMLAFGQNRSAFAQTQSAALADTPNQRWLPPPKPYPTQAESQAKLLSRIRDMVLNSDQNNATNPSPLSDDDVESLKKAMKQFDGELPNGLSMEGLNAIPPELIAKALSDPELVRKAKELSEKFSKKDPARTSTNPEATGESAVEPEKKQTPWQRKGEESKLGENRQSFDNLMEKLRSTQQQFENSQEPSLELPPSRDLLPSNSPPANASNGTDPRTESGGPPKPQTPPVNKSLQSPKYKTDPPPTKSVPPRSNPFERNRSQQPTAPTPTEGTSQPASNQGPSRSNRDSKNTQNTDPTSRPEPSNDESRIPNTTGAESKSSGVSPNSSTDIRKELERRGFGPTLKKLVEDAQRSAAQLKLSNENQSSTTDQQTKPSAKPQMPSSPDKSSTDKLTPENIAKPSPSDETRRSAALPGAQTSPSSPKSDSDISKRIQQTGKYLNSLWRELTKDTAGTIRQSESRPASEPSGIGNERFTMSNPFNATTWVCLILLAIVAVIAYFIFRIQYQSERKKRAILEAQLSPLIDEIRSRDDLVYAFHALAKQRLTSAQAWWTCGVVTDRFEHSMPEHSNPIRALSGLYQQARYFPVDHQLTLDQIEDAKTALKQCKG